MRYDALASRSGGARTVLMPVTADSFSRRDPPVFSSAGAERTHRLQRLAAACRIFGRFGYSVGVLGHVTVRDPEHPDLLWVNPLGVSMRQVRVSQLLQVDRAGRIVSGRGAINPVGLMVHAALHEARPDVAAMCHAHSIQGAAFSSFERLLDPITQDACLFFEKQALIIEPRIADEPAAAARFAAAFADKRVAIQAGHGLFTTGETVDEAAWWFVLMNRCCEAQLLAQAAGEPKRWPAESARRLAAVLGAPKVGWLAFQTLWDEILASDPDLLE
jgi:ribulose-5-phosphate 4-epimerase/fuculose-1-phosphate aldolase